MSKRTFAKIAAQLTVSASVATAADSALDSYTDLDTDSIPVDVGTSLLGIVAGYKLAPVTNRMVDAAADRIEAFRNRKNND